MCPWKQSDSYAVVARESGRLGHRAQDGLERVAGGIPDGGVARDGACGVNVYLHAATAGAVIAGEGEGSNVSYQPAQDQENKSSMTLHHRSLQTIVGEMGGACDYYACALR